MKPLIPIDKNNVNFNHTFNMKIIRLQFTYFCRRRQKNQGIFSSLITKLLVEISTCTSLNLWGYLSRNTHIRWNIWITSVSSFENRQFQVFEVILLKTLPDHWDRSKGDRSAKNLNKCTSTQDSSNRKKCLHFPFSYL